jgi:hypothetical protein
VNDPADSYTDIELARVEHLANRRRRVEHRFALLASGERRRVAVTVGMSPSQFARLSPHDFVAAVVKYARDNGVDEKLWAEVERAHGGQLMPNPFAKE